MAEASTLVMFARVGISFLLLFVGIPMFVVTRKELASGFERMFVAFIHASVFVILIVHVLAALHLLETLSMIASSLAVFIYMLRRKQRDARHPAGIRSLMGVFDLTDSAAAFQRAIQIRAGLAWQGLKSFIRSGLIFFLRNPFSIVSFTAVLGYAAYIRFDHSFAHYYFASSDPYVHLKWAKFLQMNIFYVDGVYTFGFESVLAALSRFFLLDLYDIVRFIGPMAGMGMILSIVFALKLLSAKRSSIWMAIFIYAVYAGLPAFTWRQLSALPMEYAALFFLPGLAFWILFCRDGKRMHLLLATECLLLTVLIHPFAAECLGLGIAVSGLWFLRRVWLRRDVGRALLYLAASGVLGLLPILIGLAFGKPFFGQSLDYIESTVGASSTAGTSPGGWISLQTDSMRLLGATLILLVLIGAAVLYGRRLQRSGSKPALLPVLVFVLLVYSVFYNAPAFGLPTLLPADRLGVFLSLFIAMLAGWLLDLVAKLPFVQDRMSFAAPVLAGVVACALLLTGNIVRLPIGDRYQYDEAVQAYLQIRNQFEAGNWTIVSPVEEYPLVQAFGYHTDLWEFVQKTSAENDERITLPTADVFFYVEKLPLIGGGVLQPEESQKPFPGPVQGELTEFYYRSANRRILEAKLMNWAEWYRGLYPNRMSVYMETPNMKIYHLVQSVKMESEKLPPLPKDREGVW